MLILQTGREFGLRFRSRGFGLLLALGVVAVISAAIVGLMMLSAESSVQRRTSTSQDAINAAKAYVLDYVRQYRVLPDVPTFAAAAANIFDASGRRVLYFPSSNLTSGDICSASSANITVHRCENDAACLAPNIDTGIPFLVLSGGDIIGATLSPVFQTTIHTSSSSINSVTVFRQYQPKTPVADYADPANGSNKVSYDDLLAAATLAEVREIAGCLSKTQGDVQESGAVLSILTRTGPLPNAEASCPYSKTLSAYGRTGSYSWTSAGLPPGLGLTYSAPGATAVISGTPTLEATYTPQIAVSDGNKTATSSYSLLVTSTWADTGLTQTFACPVGYTGSISQKQQSNGCGTVSRWVETSNTCCTWTDNGFTQSALCPAGQMGSISQKQQVNSCNGNLQWVDTSNTCVPIPSATFDGGFAALNFPPTSTNLGAATATIGSGTSQVTISAAANIRRRNTTDAQPEIGVSGKTNAIDQGEAMIFTFPNGYARKLGIEFRDFERRTGAGDQKEDVILTFKDTIANTTVGALTLQPCSAAGASNQLSKFISLPDVGAYFNRVEITTGTVPITQNFYIKRMKTCDSAASTCIPSGASSTSCPYP